MNREVVSQQALEAIQPPEQGGLWVKVDDRKQSTAEREGEGEIMSFGLRHDGSQFYHKTSCELLIPRFSVT